MGSRAKPKEAKDEGGPDPWPDGGILRTLNDESRFNQKRNTSEWTKPKNVWDQNMARITKGDACYREEPKNYSLKPSEDHPDGDVDYKRMSEIFFEELQLMFGNIQLGCKHWDGWNRTVTLDANKSYWESSMGGSYWVREKWCLS